ncbi:DUF4183 domain-containing protein [Oceanobacillus saliphilus]|uniref:DUF4183 domain-containing protein n=1 Tax=Oceanobacillus saliphilus TaxID=2925834 RepID=UPI00201DC54C|nr:DUF4183 domain-containing protein [Oceanobacillus saliphilus]
MALQLMKLQIEGTVTTNVDPDSAKFFYETPTETSAGSTLTIDATSFFQNDGTAAMELPTLATDNSYFNVYVNGVVQMEGLSTYTAGPAGSLAIDVPAGGGSIIAGSPIVLDVVNFTSSSTTDITT